MSCYNNNLVITAHFSGTKGVIVNKFDCMYVQFGTHPITTNGEVHFNITWVTFAPSSYRMAILDSVANGGSD